MSIDSLQQICPANLYVLIFRTPYRQTPIIGYNTGDLRLCKVHIFGSVLAMETKILPFDLVKPDVLIPNDSFNQMSTK